MRQARSHPHIACGTAPPPNTRQILRERRIPLNLSYEVPNDETIAALREGAEILAKGGTGQSYDNADDLLDAIRAS